MVYEQAPILVEEDPVNDCYLLVIRLQHHKKAAVSEHAVEFVAVVEQQIMSAEVPRVQIENGYAVAVGQVVLEVLVAGAEGIRQISHQVKRGLLESCPGSFLGYDMMGI